MMEEALYDRGIDDGTIGYLIPTFASGKRLARCGLIPYDDAG